MSFSITSHAFSKRTVLLNYTGRPGVAYSGSGFSNFVRQDIWYRASAATRSFTLNSRVSTVFDVTSSRASRIAEVCLWILVDMVRTSMNLFLSGCFLSKIHSVPQ